MSGNTPALLKKKSEKRITAPGQCCHTCCYITYVRCSGNPVPPAEPPHRPLRTVPGQYCHTCCILRTVHMRLVFWQPCSSPSSSPAPSPPPPPPPLTHDLRRRLDEDGGPGVLPGARGGGDRRAPGRGARVDAALRRRTAATEKKKKEDKESAQQGCQFGGLAILQKN